MISCRYYDSEEEDEELFEAFSSAIMSDDEEEVEDDDDDDENHSVDYPSGGEEEEETKRGSCYRRSASSGSGCFTCHEDIPNDLNDDEDDDELEKGDGENDDDMSENSSVVESHLEYNPEEAIDEEDDGISKDVHGFVIDDQSYDSFLIEERFKEIFETDLLLEDTDGRHERFARKAIWYFPELAYDNEYSAPHDAARTEYDDYFSEKENWTPFHHMLYAPNVETKTILQTLEANKTVMDYRVWVPAVQVFLYPLSMACLCRSHDTELIQYLIKFRPDTLLEYSIPSSHFDISELYDYDEDEEYYSWNDYLPEEAIENIGRLPIHFAMHQKAPRETIDLLLHEGPEAVFMREQPPSIPDTSMSRLGRDCFSLAYQMYGARSHVVERVLQTIHQVVASYKTDETYEVTREAYPLTNTCPRAKVMERLLRGLRNVKLALSFESRAGQNSVYDPIMERSIVVLDPDAGFYRFIDVLRGNKSIESLHAQLLLDWKILEPRLTNKLDGPSMALCMKHNSTLKKLTLDFSLGVTYSQEVNGLDHSVSVLLQGLVAGLAHNRTMKSLQLVNCHLKNESILQKLSSGISSSLVELTICNSTILEGESSKSSSSVTSWTELDSALRKKSHLKEICLKGNFMSLACIFRLLISVAQLPRLENLHILHASWGEEWEEKEGPKDGPDFSKAILQLLARNKLSVLELGGLSGLQMSSIFEALKNNTSLRTLLLDSRGEVRPQYEVRPQHEKTVLELLEVHNTSLICLNYSDRVFPFSFDGNEKVDILLMSNLLGRGKLKPGFPLRSFVKILSAIPSTAIEVPHQSLNLCYHLLHHCPSIWCTAGGTSVGGGGSSSSSKTRRKRKRNDLEERRRVEISMV